MERIRKEKSKKNLQNEERFKKNDFTSQENHSELRDNLLKLDVYDR
jgi:hypothetical protein